MTEDLRSPSVTPPANTAPLPAGYRVGRALRMGLGLMLVFAGVAFGLFLWSETRIQVEETSTSHVAADRVLLDLRAAGRGAAVRGTDMTTTTEVAADRAVGSQTVPSLPPRQQHA